MTDPDGVRAGGNNDRVVGRRRVDATEKDRAVISCRSNPGGRTSADVSENAKRSVEYKILSLIHVPDDSGARLRFEIANIIRQIRLGLKCTGTANETAERKNCNFALHATPLSLLAPWRSSSTELRRTLPPHPQSVKTHQGQTPRSR